VIAVARSIASPAPEPGYRSVAFGLAGTEEPSFDIYVRDDIDDDVLEDLDAGLGKLNQTRIARGDLPYVRMGGLQ
jgi:hypothetical protein